MPGPPFFPPRSERRVLAFVAEEFPFPVALTYVRLHDEMDRQEPIAAAWQVRDTLECALKFCACLALADCFRELNDLALADRLLSRLFKPMSLGDWHTLLEDALRPLAPLARQNRLDDSGRLLPGLHGIFFGRGGRSALGTVLAGTESEQGLVKWRNSVFGHGVFREERDYYAAQVLRWLPTLNNWLAALRPVLDGWTLVGRTPGDERIDWRGTLGLPPVAPHEHKPWGEPLPLLLIHADGRELPLGPLLALHECAHPGCRQPAPFFFEGNEYDRKRNRHRTHFLEHFRGSSRTQQDWSETCRLAERFQKSDGEAVLEWQRASYNWREAAAQVRALFRDFDQEYRRPDYLLDELWPRLTERAGGYVHLAGREGVGKSFLVRGLEREGRERGVAVLAYHILPGQLGDYRAFTSELADRAKERLEFRTQEVQTRTAGIGQWQEQMTAFLAELMRANGLTELVLVIDGLDQLRDPESPATPLVSDFLPPADQLPPGCTVVLTSRPNELRPRVKARLEERARQAPALWSDVRLIPSGEGNRGLLRGYLAEQLPERFRNPETVEEVLRRSEGVFLYATHFARALAAGVFADAASLPAAGQFYPIYLARLRERVGQELYESAYLPVLLLLTAARRPVTLAQLVRWGVPRDRLEFALLDLHDFLRQRRGRAWHDSLVDDGDDRYELAHEAFQRWVMAEPDLAGKLRDTHARIARVALDAHAGRWDAINAADEAAFYDLHYLTEHLQATEDVKTLETVLADDTYVQGCWEVALVAERRGRFLLEEQLCYRMELVYRAFLQVGRTDLTDKLGIVVMVRGAALMFLGRLQESLALCDEAIKILGRPGAGADPKRQAALAVTRSNRTIVLNRLGRPAEAIAESYHAAAELGLVARDADVDRDRVLALTLTNRALALWTASRLDESLAASGEAIAIFRRLVGAGRDDLEEELALALMNRGVAFLSLGRFGESATASAEAADILERHLAAGQVAQVQNLPSVLSNLAAALANLGRLDDALEASNRAEVILRRLLDRGRDEVASLLAMVLTTRSLILHQAGRADESVEASGQAVDVLSRLIEGHPELKTDLVTMLINQSVTLDEVGRYVEALAACDHAIVLLEPLLARRPELESDLALLLMNRGKALEGLGRFPEMADSYGRSVAVFRKLIEQGRPDLGEPFARALLSHGLILLHLDQPDEALACFDEVISVREALIAAGQVQSTAELVEALKFRFRLLWLLDERTRAFGDVLGAMQCALPLLTSPGRGGPLRQRWTEFLISLRELDPGDREQLYAFIGEQADALRSAIEGA